LRLEGEGSPRRRSRRRRVVLRRSGEGDRARSEVDPDRRLGRERGHPPAARRGHGAFAGEPDGVARRGGAPQPRPPRQRARLGFRRSLWLRSADASAAPVFLAHAPAGALPPRRRPSHGRQPSPEAGRDRRWHRLRRRNRSGGEPLGNPRAPRRRSPTRQSLGTGVRAGSRRAGCRRRRGGGADPGSSSARFSPTDSAACCGATRCAAWVERV
jgi:hypothetical protein